MFLIECPQNDPSGMLVKQRLDSMGAETAHLNTALYPKQIQIHYNPEMPEQGKLQLPHSNKWILLSDIQGVCGKHTVQLSEEDIYHAGFAEHLTKIPVKIQECINGMDIRVYVIGEDCFALEIHSDKLDFRKTPNTFRKAIELPEAIRQQCLLICKTLGLHMAGIDIKRTETGEHVFLEANPSPVFLYDEVASGYPISQTIANLLMA